MTAAAVTTTTTPSPERGVNLVASVRRFAHESRARSWWYLGTTFVAIVCAFAVAILAPWWPLRLLAGVLAGLAMTRGFILYHDYMHGAILRKSRLARALLSAFGIFVLAPPRSWRASHNFHHAHVGKIEGSDVGSFALMTTTMWRNASRGTRFRYRVVRHPLTILFAYLTVFMWAITLAPLLRKPAKHWDSAIALALHGGLLATAFWLGGATMACFAIFVPFATAGALGAYLFFAQHTFPRMRVIPADEWTMQRAALESCSYLHLGPLMSWFTGDIGFHHVHHFNAAIPFYRLGEAMRAVPELQRPADTSLRPRDMLACLRLKLWDDAQGKMVGYPKRASRSTAR